MSFKLDKEKTLKRMLTNDQSNKGSVDKLIKPLVDKINNLKDYYTTSSCSGRVIVIKVPKNGKKKDAEFLYRTHEFASAKKILTCLKNLKTDESVWFRQEPAIVHVATRTLEEASNFLRTVRPIGFKRGGLFEVDKRFLIESVSTERIDAMLAKDGKVLVSDEYIEILVEEANKRLERTWEKTKKLESEISKLPAN
ncbi:hypothetical protein ACFLTH_13445 [Bacteroidota bacterium]